MSDADETAPAARGDTTREALVRAAIAIFGRDGFGAASTRAISEAAGVNQALIGYHFGGKPGLYRAAITFIADSVASRIGPLVTAIETELARDEPAGAGAEGRPTCGRAAARADRCVRGNAHERGIVGLGAADPARAAGPVGSLRHPLRRHHASALGRRGAARRTRASRPGDAGRGEAHGAHDPRASARVPCGARSGAAPNGWSRIAPGEIQGIQAELRRNVAAMLAVERRR